eukprot:Rhum_TRINITY_DN7574_c0_g1::Rhum_TRINITY_DN7574_c0_g1_i2::g.23676::m.23676
MATTETTHFGYSVTGGSIVRASFVRERTNSALWLNYNKLQLLHDLHQSRAYWFSSAVFSASGSSAAGAAFLPPVAMTIEETTMTPTVTMPPNAMAITSVVAQSSSASLRRRMRSSFSTHFHTSCCRKRPNVGPSHTSAWQLPCGSARDASAFAVWQLYRLPTHAADGFAPFSARYGFTASASAERDDSVGLFAGSLAAMSASTLSTRPVSDVSAASSFASVTFTVAVPMNVTPDWPRAHTSWIVDTGVPITAVTSLRIDVRTSLLTGHTTPVENVSAYDISTVSCAVSDFRHTDTSGDG